MRNRDPIITEFAVQVRESGRITWDGLDEFIWWLLHRKPPEGLESYAKKIQFIEIKKALLVFILDLRNTHLFIQRPIKDF